MPSKYVIGTLESFKQFKALDQQPVGMDHNDERWLWFEVIAHELGHLHVLIEHGHAVPNYRSAVRSRRRMVFVNQQLEPLSVAYRDLNEALAVRSTVEAMALCGHKVTREQYRDLIHAAARPYDVSHRRAIYKLARRDPECARKAAQRTVDFLLEAGCVHRRRA